MRRDPQMIFINEHLIMSDSFSLCFVIRPNDIPLQNEHEENSPSTTQTEPATKAKASMSQS